MTREAKSLEFNFLKDPNFYKEEDVDYMINMLKYNHKSLNNTLLMPIFQKSMATLARLMSDEELCLQQVYDKIQSKLLSRPETEVLNVE